MAAKGRMKKMNYKQLRDMSVYLFIVLLVSFCVFFTTQEKGKQVEQLPTDKTEFLSEKGKNSTTKTNSKTEITENNHKKNETNSKKKNESTANKNISANYSLTSSKNEAYTEKSISTSVPAETTTFIHPEINRCYGTFSCRRLGINDLKVYYGDNEFCLSKGIGTSTQSALPGFGARTLMSAHNLTYFAPMKDVAVNDIFELNLKWGYYRYRVYKTEVMAPKEFDPGLIRVPSDEIIVYTCYPFNGQSGSAQRIFMFCEMLEGPRMY